eukprot:TRINITY_DN3015_c0_g1_i1.p2 TRINITY_DN3015_c0_g1~~TRINITY_DN3015_c0_g1_i1.p2  ORF type:complete len:442 (-),score=91.68 TRINITY_DN3015_c0_g1_i1:2749-4074(-)
MLLMAGRPIGGLLGVLSLVFVCVHGACAAAPPTIPESYECDCKMTQYGIVSTGHMQQDGDAMQYHWTLKTPSIISPSRITLSSVFQFADYQIIVVNGVCRNNTAPSFSSIFNWVPYSHFVGNDTVNGVACAEWAIIVGTVSTSVCVTDGDIPLRLRVADEKTGEVTLDWFFIDFVPTTPDIPALPKTCSQEAQDYICPGGSIKDLEMIRFHSAGDYTLKNKNVADMLGDTAFICMTTDLDMRPGSSWISKFIITTNTSWGQYGFCNNDACMGGNAWSVGREATTGLLAYGGQCQDLTNVGAWYSLREDAECNDTSAEARRRSIEEGTCAWQTKQLVKTIDLSCLANHSFIEHCLNDKGLPFPTATQTLENAFATEDPAQGGCPDIQPMDAQLRTSPVRHSNGRRPIARQLSDQAPPLATELSMASPLIAMQAHVNWLLEHM